MATGRATGTTSFYCPNCNALYQLVKVEAGSETVDCEFTCRACGGLLPARQDKYVLKYFMLRKGGRIQQWRGVRGSSR